MPRWKPKANWKGQEVFVLGGGYSLKKRNFDWNLLKAERVVGCNDAFKLGVDICDICIFGDKRWFNYHKNELAKYKGTVITNAPFLANSTIPWIWFIGRESKGLYADKLGWNGNTGASAINLAIVLGASKIYLLGYDMKLIDGRSNWHDEVVNKDAVKPKAYERFRDQFRFVKTAWRKHFSDREIINVTDDSALDIFPKVGFDEFWKTRSSTMEGGNA